MKKSLFAFFASLLTLPLISQAEDLLQVYHQALHSDPTYLQAVAQFKSDEENVPIARAAILPSISLATATASFAQSRNTGTTVVPNADVRTRGYKYDLNLSQTLFDMSQFDTLSQAKIALRGNRATYSAALQDLMSRVSDAYFAILKAREELRYSYANMQSLARQYQQTEQQYHVGLKTRSDVDLAQSTYDNAVAQHISSINALANAREDLRAITNKYYKHIYVLRKDLPLISPYPADPERWVNVAKKQNYTVLSFRYAALAARRGVSIAWDGHLPTLSLSLDYQRSVSAAWDYRRSHTPFQTTGATGPSASLNLTVPIFAGGLISANTRQAEANYSVAQRQYDFNMRDAVNQTRQAYLSVIAGISQIKADRQAVISGESALRGDEAGYRVGTKTIVEVLQAQDNLFQAQTQYAEDRFSYITNSIKLKEETGTLSVKDLQAINNWLIDSKADDHAEAIETKQPKLSTYISKPLPQTKKVSHATKAKKTKKQKITPVQNQTQQQTQ